MFLIVFFLIKRLIHRICVMISGQEKKEEKTGKASNSLERSQTVGTVTKMVKKGLTCCVSLFLLAFTYLCNVIVVCLCFALVAYCRCFPEGRK